MLSVLGKIAGGAFECFLWLLASLCLLVAVGVLLGVGVGLLKSPTPAIQQDVGKEATIGERGERIGPTGRETVATSGPAVPSPSQGSRGTPDTTLLRHVAQKPPTPPQKAQKSSVYVQQRQTKETIELNQLEPIPGCKNVGVEVTSQGMVKKCFDNTPLWKD